MTMPIVYVRMKKFCSENFCCQVKMIENRYVQTVLKDPQGSIQKLHWVLTLSHCFFDRLRKRLPKLRRWQERLV